ncbi:MAG: hypothetical protein LBB55_00105 [Zoogloeaceae bacterium]|nr:hypothetical protein [Zoogloeaceae bacterium]
MNGSAPRDENTYRFILDERTRKLNLLNDSTGKVCLKIILFLFIGSFSIVVGLYAIAFLFIVPSTHFLESLDLWIRFYQSIVMDFLLSPDKGFLWFLLLVGVAFLHSHARKIGIVADKKGITFNSFLFLDIGKHYEWHEFAQIRRSHFRGNEVIVFIDRYGKSFRIQFGKETAQSQRPGFFSWFFSSFHSHWKGEIPRPFVGDGHPFSLPEIIEKFHAPVTPLDEAERKKIPALTGLFSWDVGIAGRAGHLVLAALCMALLSFVLYNQGMDFFLLETWQSRGLILVCWLAGGLGFVFSWRYLRDLRQKESWEAAWIVSLSFAACLWFLVTSIASLLPVYGETRQEAFFVVRAPDGLYEASRQYWHSVNEPDRLSFWVKIPRERRQYDPGAQREFTIHHGPLGLHAMPLSEIEPLWTKE